MANRCPSCGKFLSASDKKCPNCGYIFDGSAKPIVARRSEKKVVLDEEKVDVSAAPSIIKEGSAPIIITRYEQIVKHEEADFSGPSYFDGKFHQYLGWTLLGWLVTTFTLGICYPLWYAWIAKWECRHTVTCGYRQVFDGKAGSLIPRWLLWYFLTIITLTIFGWWNPIRFRRWKVARIKLVKDTKQKKHKKARK